jgi:cholesterol transport system auxiliary component
MIGIIAGVLGMLPVSSCTVLPAASGEPQKALITKMPTDLPRHETRAAVLLVFPPEAAPLYDTTQMAYTNRAHQIDYFSQHEWGEPPSQMLFPLLVKTLENAHYFSTVLTPPYLGRYTYALRTEILELTQDFTAEPATLILSLRLQLSDGATDKVIATEEISLREPMLQKTPYAGVEAANNAAAKALEETARFVLEKTR